MKFLKDNEDYIIETLQNEFKKQLDSISLYTGVRKIIYLDKLKYKLCQRIVDFIPDVDAETRLYLITHQSVVDICMKVSKL